MITPNTQQLSTDFQALGFEIEITQDGSPTLRLHNQGESMHHSGGAAAETRHIYGHVLDQTHQILRESCKTCVVGLGLGYIEISWAMSLLKAGLEPSASRTFHSFELVPGLIKSFQEWIHSSQPHPVYDVVVQKIDQAVRVEDIKTILQKALKTGSSLKGDFSDFSQHAQKYNVICYDAFSKKTSEGLWGSEFLKNFFQKFSETDCVVTTYACTGVFRKNLIEQNFAFFKRPGFCGKRDSSLATRGRLSLEDFPWYFSQTSSCIQ